MKARILMAGVFFCVFSAGLFAQNDEITIWDRRGKPVCYVSPVKGNTVYLFDGTPVAYFMFKGEINYVYGFNGRHLGWFTDGVMRDMDGDAVGCEKDVIRMMYDLEPLKGIKKELPLKQSIEEPHPMPTWRPRWSELALSMFLHAGIEKTDARKMRRSPME